MAMSVASRADALGRDVRSRSDDESWLVASPHTDPGHVGRRTSADPRKGFTPSQPRSCVCRNQARPDGPPLSSPKWVMNPGAGARDIVDAPIELKTAGVRVRANHLSLVENATGNSTTIPMLF